MSAIYTTADILSPTLIVIGPSVSASGQAIVGVFVSRLTKRSQTLVPRGERASI